MCLIFWGVIDVLKEFAAKKSVKLGKLLKERGGLGLGVGPGPETRKRESGGGTKSSFKSESFNVVKVKILRETNFLYGL